MVKSINEMSDRLAELVEDLGGQEFINAMNELSQYQAFDNIEVPYMSLPSRLRMPALAVLIHILHLNGSSIDMEKLSKAVEVAALGPAIEFLQMADAYQPGPGPE